MPRAEVCYIGPVSKSVKVHFLLFSAQFSLEKGSNYNKFGMSPSSRNCGIVESTKIQDGSFNVMIHLDVGLKKTRMSHLAYTVDNISFLQFVNR